MYIPFNKNPIAQRGEDCTIRAIAKATDKTWIDTFLNICLYAVVMYDMPSANRVWGNYLYDLGFRRHLIDEPITYTVNDFVNDHPKGKYILALNGHVVAVEDGNYYDTWDSGYETPIYYWRKEV